MHLKMSPELKPTKTPQGTPNYHLGAIIQFVADFVLDIVKEGDTGVLTTLLNPLRGSIRFRSSTWGYKTPPWAPHTMQ